MLHHQRRTSMGIPEFNGPVRKRSWSHFPELNRGPTLYESVALPTELKWRWLFQVDLAKIRSNSVRFSCSNRKCPPGVHLPGQNLPKPETFSQPDEAFPSPPLQIPASAKSGSAGFTPCWGPVGKNRDVRLGSFPTHTVTCGLGGGTRSAMREDAAGQELMELLCNVPGQAVAAIGIGPHAIESRQVPRKDLVERGPFGSAASLGVSQLRGPGCAPVKACISGVGR